MKTFLIGSNISNSQSPALHRAWIAAHGLAATYDLLETTDFEEAFHSKCDDAIGFNITAPFKDDAVEFCDELSKTARAVGSVNTMVLEDGKWVGHNTDSHGFRQGLAVDHARIHSALVLGCGGAAKAVLHGLLAIGDIEITLASRNDDKARRIAFNHLVNHADWFDFDRDLRPYDLIVNATGSRDLEVDLTQTGAIIYDLLYGEESAMIKAGKAQRLKTIDGSEMLKHQAAKSFKLWFDIDPVIQQNS